MSRFIRKTKTASGATAVQIVTKDGRRVTSIDHIGSAHNAIELEFLIALAKKSLQGGQLSFDLLKVKSGMSPADYERANAQKFDSLCLGN